MNPFALEREYYVLLYDEDGLTAGKLYLLQMVGGVVVIKPPEYPLFCFPDIYDDLGRGLIMRSPTRLGRFMQWIT